MSQMVPERHTKVRCQAMVEGTIMAYPCTLPQGHQESGEPCYAVEVGRSVRRWQQWKTEQNNTPADPAAGLREHVAAGQEQIKVCTGCGIPSTAPGHYNACPTQDDPTWISREEEHRRALEAEVASGRAFMDCGMVCVEAKEHTPADPQCIMRPQEPTKQRDGDQVLPTGDESQPDVQSQVIDDIHARLQVGIERYGQGLKPFNGRKTLLDTYEESLDQTIYLRSLLTMQEATRERLVSVVLDAWLVKHPAWDRDDAHDLAEQAVDSILDAFSGPPAPAPDEVIKAFGTATTQTRIPAAQRHEASEVVRLWLTGA